jgi:hypothetical protein
VTPLNTMEVWVPEGAYRSEDLSDGPTARAVVGRGAGGNVLSGRGQGTRGIKPVLAVMMT